MDWDRKKIFDNIVEVIGKTPMVRLHRVVSEFSTEVLAKLEHLNPGGSIKDRIGITMVKRAEMEGKLKPGGVIVEATSGNTGMGIAMVAAVKGYKCIFVMPDKMSEEKRALLRAMGADVVICPTDVEPEDPRSYYKVSERIAKETGGVFLNQYENPGNPEAHYLFTAQEIWEQTEGSLDAIVIGMGTGGTITGIGKYFKEKAPSVRIVGVDPLGSVYTEYFTKGTIPEPHVYDVEGIGEDFLPVTMDFSIVDDVVQVSDEESFIMARRLAREEGIFLGGSSGAALAGGIKYLRKSPHLKRIVIIFPDSGYRYLTKFYSKRWLEKKGYNID